MLVGAVDASAGERGRLPETTLEDGEPSAPGWALPAQAAGGNGYSMVIDPAGQILHRGSVQEEIIPIEVDFDLVRRQRREGILRMGQPHKSFRDNKVAFPVYGPDFDRSYLDALGPLVKPGRPAR